MKAKIREAIIWLSKQAIGFGVGFLVSQRRSSKGEFIGAMEEGNDLAWRTINAAMVGSSSSDYDLGYSDGRAGEPLGWSHRAEALSGNLKLSEEYRKGFYAGVEARKTSGGD